MCSISLGTVIRKEILSLFSAEDKINSTESEGAFNDFIVEQLDEIIDNILNDAELDSMTGDRTSDVIVEMDDIVPPTFVYDDSEEGEGAGQGGQGPGTGGGDKLIFNLPFEKLMEKMAEKLQLPKLNKEGDGKIKENIEVFNDFGQYGSILDKKRTFKTALKKSIGMGLYDPANDKYELRIHRRDKKYRVPQTIEKPKYDAAVMYIGDISYSTYGERLELTKRLVFFIQSWLDFNYGKNNIEHRFFVHDSEAY